MKSDIIANISTLEGLAAYINSCEDYNNEIVESVCERNGWATEDDEWHIANDGKKQVIFDDNTVAIVTPMAL